MTYSYILALALKLSSLFVGFRVFECSMEPAAACIGELSIRAKLPCRKQFFKPSCCQMKVGGRGGSL